MARQMPIYSVVAGKYILGQIIGKGSFGEVYLATVEGEDNIYAMKREDQSVKNPQLLYEAKILKNLNKAVGFPKVIWSGQQNKAAYMVMDLLGPSLEDLLFLCNCKFTLKTVLMLADQMLYRIQQLHMMNYLHRDIKPQNFLMGLDENSGIVHLVDFGLSKRYRDAKTHQHTPYKENKMVTGTIRYSSINTHFGFEQGRRDDLESIGFILIYFLKGSLPWQGIKANNKSEKYQKIQEKKLATPVQAQCRDLPIQFSTFMNYCRSLKYQEKPDYRFLRKNFKDLFERVGFVNDGEYDWCCLQSRKHLDLNNLSLIIEKEGDNIQELEGIKKGLVNEDQLIQSDINVKVSATEEKGSQNLVQEYEGSENVADESFDQSQLPPRFRHRRSSSNQGLKLLEFNNIDE